MNKLQKRRTFCRDMPDMSIFFSPLKFKLTAQRESHIFNIKRLAEKTPLQHIRLTTLSFRITR